MQASPVALFIAGFVAGGIVLGGVAHARITMLNVAVAGVYPNSEGTLLCVTQEGKLRAATGVQRNAAVSLAGVNSYGVTMRCPA